jgi:hypothetical protein|tara:strand:- start:427 stop:579 length:153 start_codon:yes stop_codon:yes gene_type:complete
LSVSATKLLSQPRSLRLRFVSVLVDLVVELLNLTMDGLHRIHRHARRRVV